MWAGGLFVLGCVAGNLASGHPATVGGAVVSAPVTVERHVPDGAAWNAPGTVIVSASDPLTVDLGEVQELRALALQGDDNDEYVVEGSVDGQSWRTIWTAARAFGMGLRTRHHVLDDAATARFLRIYGQAGDGRYAIGWVGAYCRVPDPFPEDPSRRSPLVLWRSLDDGAVVALKGLLASAGALLLLAGAWLRWRGREALLRRTRDVILGVLGLLAFAGWFNFGRFHYDDHVHQWDIYHYYIGAKYLPELGYTRMYECTTIAEAEVFGAASVAGRTITNLTTNLVEPAAPAVAEPTRCTSRFSPERWRAFTEDIRFFRGLFTESRWREVLHDHGYNGSPVWGILGRALSLGPAAPGQLELLALIDPLLLVVMWAFVAWAFGWRTACVALLYWGTNYPARYFWNGGAFLRQDWLCAAVVGVCLTRRDRPVLGGFAVGASALLRIFPGFLFAGLLAKLVAGWIAERRLHVPVPTRRFLLGGLLAGAVLVPLAVLAGSGRPEAVAEFVDNSRKHLETPLTNNMGWKTVVGYQKLTRASVQVRPAQADAWGGWKDARRRTFDTRRPIFVAGVVVFVLLLGWASAGQADWVALVLGVGLIAFAAELTCYYYSILLLYALLWPRQPLVGVGLLAVAAAGAYMPRFVFWDDARYYDISLWCLVFIVAATVLVGLVRPEGRALTASPPASNQHA